MTRQDSDDKTILRQKHENPTNNTTIQIQKQNIKIKTQKPKMETQKSKITQKSEYKHKNTITK